MARTRRRTAAKKTKPGNGKAKGALHYKVVELSNVDEGSIERTINEWVPQGWTFDGVQFAMRESSKRPSMAFVYFTREGAPVAEQQHEPGELARYRDEEAATAHLRRIAIDDRPPPAAAVTSTDAWARLKQLAGEEDQDEGPGFEGEES